MAVSVRGAVAALVSLPSLACIQMTTGTGTGPNASDAAAAAASAGSDAGAPGTNCTQDPQSQITLCAGIAACPSVTVDPNAFPGCGFRLYGGSALDLECLCSGSLCPIGVPASCEQAAQLLQSQSALLVCQQVSEGRCLAFAGPDAGGGVPSSCDRNCQAACGSAPDCLQICGC
jgi:hypothetical protein